jgi:hypothetical protein
VCGYHHSAEAEVNQDGGQKNANKINYKFEDTIFRRVFGSKCGDVISNFGPCLSRNFVTHMDHFILLGEWCLIRYGGLYEEEQT